MTCCSLFNPTKPRLSALQGRAEFEVFCRTGLLGHCLFRQIHNVDIECHLTTGSQLRRSLAPWVCIKPENSQQTLPNQILAISHDTNQTKVAETVTFWFYDTMKEHWMLYRL